MISYPVYKVLHLLGLMMLFIAFGGAIARSRSGTESSPISKRFVSITHGVGLFLLLVAGFGLLARLGLVRGLPGWTLAKIGIWVIMGGLLALANRKPALAKPLWVTTLGLGLLAAYLAVMKPF